MPVPESVYELPGWCPKDKTLRIYNLIKETKSDLTVEFGIFGGRSMIPMAIAHKEMNHGLCIGVDPWSTKASTDNYDTSDVNFQWWNALDHEAIYKVFMDALNDYQVTPFTKVYRTKSKDVLHLFDDETINVLHQDGNHSQEISSEEVELFSSKVKAGGFWIMDDTNWDTTTNAQELILQKGFILYEDYTSWKIYKKESST